MAIHDRIRLTGLLRKKPWRQGFFHRSRPILVCANIRSYGRNDPARRRRLVLRVGRAAGRPAATGAPRDRRGRGRARGQLRGEGVRRPDGDGRPPGAAAVPAGGRRLAANERLLRGEQGDVPGLRGRDAARRGAFDRRGVPRRARHAPARRLARRDRCTPAARRARAGRASDHGRGRAHEVPREGGERRREAGRPARRPADGELDFLHPLPVERLWGVGPKTAARLHDRGIRTVGQVAELTQDALVAMLGRATGRHLHALAHNHDRRRVRTGRRRGSIGSQRALGCTTETPRRDRRDPRRARRPRHRPHAAGRARGPDGRAPAPLRRLRPRDALAHAAACHRRDGRDPPRSARAARRRRFR